MIPISIYTPVVQSRFLRQGLFSQPKWAALQASGVLDVDTAGLTARGGEFVNVPRFVQASDFERCAIGTTSDVKSSFVAFATNDGKVPVLRDMSLNKYYKHQLALTGEDFASKWSETIGNKIAKRSLRVLNYSMYGLLGTALSAHVNDISGASTKTCNVLAVQDARAKLGDAADKLTTLLLHSKAWNSLLKDLISNYKYAGVWSGNLIQDGMLETVLGCRNIIISDDMTPTADDTTTTGDDYYYSYLLGEGALYFAYQQEPYVDVWEDPTNADTIHYMKVAMDYVAAPRAATFSVANPTDANLKNAANWSVAYEDHRNALLAAVVSKES